MSLSLISLTAAVSWRIANAVQVQQPADLALVSEAQKLVRRATDTVEWKSSEVDSAGLVEMVDRDEPLAYTVQVHKALPHYRKPWTQGLEFTSDGQRLIETSGSYPAGQVSYIRTLDPSSGTELFKTSTGVEHYFIEGITEFNGLYYASTYHDHKMLTYDEDFKLIKTGYSPLGEGWGLTRSPQGDSLLATNGSEWLMTLRAPAALAEGGNGDFAIVGAKQITCFGKPVAQVNELEMVGNFMGQGPMLLGNILNTRLALLIDPESAKCKGVLSLSNPNLEAIEDKEAGGLHVANGIALNKATGRFFITGKNWNQLFEVSVVQSPNSDPTACLKDHLLQQRRSHANLLRCR